MLEFEQEYRRQLVDRFSSHLSILIYWPYMEAMEHISENDRIWGVGNWVMCTLPGCTSAGKPTFHHVEFHG